MILLQGVALKRSHLPFSLLMIHCCFLNGVWFMEGMRLMPLANFYVQWQMTKFASSAHKLHVISSIIRSLYPHYETCPKELYLININCHKIVWFTQNLFSKKFSRTSFMYIWYSIRTKLERKLLWSRHLLRNHSSCSDIRKCSLSRARIRNKALHACRALFEFEP